jgi:hypothetical protein
MILLDCSRWPEQCYPNAPEDEDMSQRGVERALGKLVTDEEFREAFFADPTSACLRVGVELSRSELEALSRVPRSALAEFCRRVDDRICRLHVPSPSPAEERRS